MAQLSILISDSIELSKKHAQLRKSPPEILLPELSSNIQYIATPAYLHDTGVYDIIASYLHHIQEIREKREPLLLNGDWEILDGVICFLEGSLSCIGQNVDNKHFPGLAAAMLGLGIWNKGIEAWFTLGCLAQAFPVIADVNIVKLRLKRELDELKLTYYLEF